MELKAVLCTFNKPNSNGFVYSKEEMQKAIENFKSKNVRAGELRFNYTDDSLETHLGQISHVVKDINIENDDVVCDVELLNTPSGRIAQEIVDHGINLKFRPKITAEPVYEIDENGNQTNKIIDYKNYQIISVDIVP